MSNYGKKCPFLPNGFTKRNFFITFNVLQTHLLMTLYYCTFDTKRMKKTKELILRAVEKTAQKINIIGNQTLAERNPYRYRSYYYEKAMSEEC